MTVHPRVALFDADEPAPAALPVCDHYAGVEARMRKSLELQADLVVDVGEPLRQGAADALVPGGHQGTAWAEQCGPHGGQPLDSHGTSLRTRASQRSRSMRQRTSSG